jgi:hypothetical protein
MVERNGDLYVVVSTSHKAAKENDIISHPLQKLPTVIVDEVNDRKAANTRCMARVSSSVACCT